ncbi:hypothetical protein GCM10022240_06000 [Microbacterium kribbense]|uniref:SsuA/THI5-like domain-containing protein n=1 Tax=Microbacterium kribbense TaxID=433645 RepID=A0ABP7G660_9MICO
MNTKPLPRLRRPGTVALALGAALTLVTGLTACSTDAGAPAEAAAADGTAVTTIRVQTPPFAFEGVEIGIRNGIFAKHGLKVVSDYAGGDPTSQIAKVVSGQLDLAMSGGPDAIRAVAKGIPIMITGGAQHSSADGEPTDGILVAPDSPIKDWKDLTGATIGISGLGSLPQIVTDIALEKNGVDFSTVKYVNLPNDALEGAAAKGQIDAALPTSVFYTKAVADGFRALGRGTKEFFPGAPQIVWVASKAFVQKNATALKAFNEAMAEANAYANQHPDLIRQIDHEKTKLPAAFIDNRPIEKMDNTVDRNVYATLTGAMNKFGFVEKNVSVDDVVWKDAPQP